MAKKILLADDSITIQKVVELTFSDGDYEVTAVNNGAKAIQKLSEMRPDIVLSDIIMPEKNGYEVCEFIKSHPEFRSIPVVLLTGTFEPFDPERAEKAGCDAVVTKPFESQSLIHKIDELIAASRSASGSGQTQATSPAAPSPFATSAPDSVASWPAPAPPAAAPLFGSANDSFGASAADSPFDSTGGGSFRLTPHHESDVFGSPSSHATPPPFAPPAATPPAEPEFGGETRAFPRMSFDDLQTPPTAQPAPPPPPPAAEPEAASPFSSPADEASPWDTSEPAPSAFGGETKAFPRMSFDDIPPMTPAAPPAPAEDPWETPEPAAHTEAAPSSSAAHELPPLEVDHFQSAGSTAADPGQDQPPPSPPSVWDEPPAAPSTWLPDSLGSQLAASADFAPAAASPFAESPSGSDEASPFGAHASEDSSSPASASSHEPAPVTSPWSEHPAETQTESEGEMYEPAGNELSEAQIDRIARRVVQLMSDQLVRNIAWEVIPDLAEMVVKERVRQLESDEN